MTKTPKAKPGRKPKNPNRDQARSAHFKLSDRSRFALRWLTAHEGDRKDKTVVLEEMITDRADLLSKGKARHWSDLYHDDPAIQTLNLFSISSYRPTTMEQPIQRFVGAHPSFFYSDEEQQRPHLARAIILWPRVKEFVSLWESKRIDDYWCAAKAMRDELKKHGEPAPKGGTRW